MENDSIISETNGNKLSNDENGPLFSSYGEVITEFTDDRNIICDGALDAYGTPYNTVVTALRDTCFTWVFIRNNRVVGTQSTNLTIGQQHRGYTTDGLTTVGINCGC